MKQSYRMYPVKMKLILKKSHENISQEKEDSNRNMFNHIKRKCKLKPHRYDIDQTAEIQLLSGNGSLLAHFWDGTTAWHSLPMNLQVELALAPVRFTCDPHPGTLHTRSQGQVQ